MFKQIALSSFSLFALVGIINNLPTESIDKNTNILVVTSIHDGDTITAIPSDSNEPIKVRLACIDAPELGQSSGSNALSQLNTLVRPGNRLTYTKKTNDRYGRTVTELFLNSKSINLSMVQSGQAAVYRKYMTLCKSTKQMYYTAEEQAQQQNLGMWADSNICLPWDFRSKKCK